MRERCMTGDDHAAIDNALGRRSPGDRVERAARLVALGGDVRAV